MDVNEVVAKNLKSIRDRKQLSLDATAQLTGVSKSMLGQIERGDVNPTISVLWKIANGLKVSFSSLVERPFSNAVVVRNEDGVSLTECDGKIINHPVFPFDERQGFETYRIEMLPGGKITAEPHMAGCQEYLTVFRGSMKVTVAAQGHHLNQYDSLRFPADLPHEYVNDGEETVELHMMIAYS